MNQEEADQDVVDEVSIGLMHFADAFLVSLSISTATFVTTTTTTTTHAAVTLVLPVSSTLSAVV